MATENQTEKEVVGTIVAHKESTSSSIVDYISEIEWHL